MKIKLLFYLLHVARGIDGTEKKYNNQQRDVKMYSSVILLKDLSTPFDGPW